MHNGIKILAINTTGRIINMALSFKGKIITIERDVQLGNYESIVPLVKFILKKPKIDIGQIDYFGVCTGPGSFTGIRIGLGAMKALAYSTNKPLVGFRSLDLAAWMVKDEFSGPLCIMQDARRKNIYSAVFNSDHGTINRISPYWLLEVEPLCKEIKKICKNNLSLYFYGDMVSQYKDIINKVFPNSKILQPQEDSLKSQSMISLVGERLNKKCSSFEISPFYMYPKDCQVRKHQQV